MRLAVTVTKTNTVLEINGKRYDAVSGNVIGRAHSRGSIDGVVRNKHASPQPQPAMSPKPTPTLPLASVMDTPVMDVRRTRRVTQQAQPSKKHVPQSSQTLMRQTVRKPSVSFKKNHKTHTRTDVLARQPKSVVLPKLSFHAVDPKREAHATRITQSKFVSRFGSAAVPPSTHVGPASIAVRSRAVPQTNTAKTSVTPSEPSLLPTHQPAADMFERALRKATSHEQPAPVSVGRWHARKKSRRLANASAMSLAILILGGFFVYQNMANITIRMAASRAGFAATLPGYRPSGFSIGKFAYSSGNVTVHFHSNSDAARSFALVEQPSNWDSNTLLNNYVTSTAGTSYQTASAAGRTIYLYGTNNATWVSGGIWYRVTNQNGLSTAQLVDLATSM